MRDKDTDMDEKQTEDLAARSHGNPVVVNDPGSDLVDTDPAHSTPASPSNVTKAAPFKPLGHAFSGGNLGGQSVHVCLNCYALVQESEQGNHMNWHNEMGH